MDQIGSYRIVGALGRGGMGEVLLGLDAEGRQVAIKRIGSDRVDDERVKARFRREIQMLRSLDHPAIVRCLDVFADAGSDYLVMERIDGEVLAKRLRAGKLDPSSVIRLGLDLARGLDAAHREGLVHRDLKAANVMVTSSGSARILDFGLAKSLYRAETTLSEDGKLLGTLYCMAPEQARGEPVDARVDLFALGALLYEMANGTPPLRGETEQETLARVCFHHPPPLGDSVPAGLSHLVEHLLQKDRDNRPPDASRVAEALEILHADSERTDHRWLSGPPVPDAFEPTRDDGSGKGSSWSTAVRGFQGRDGSPRPRNTLWRWATRVALASLGVAAWWLLSDVDETDTATSEPKAPVIAILDAVTDSDKVEDDEEIPGGQFVDVLADVGGRSARISVLRHDAWRYGLDLDPGTPIDVWRALGASHALETTVLPLGTGPRLGLVRYAMRLVEVASGDLVASWEGTASSADLEAWAIEAANQMHDALDLPALSPVEPSTWRLEQATLLDSLRRFHGRRALDRLVEIEAEHRDAADYWLLRSTLEHDRGDTKAAEASAGQALDRIPDTDDPRRARALHLAGRPREALAIYQQLSSRRPRDHQLRLAQLEAALEADDSRVALTIADETSFADDPRLLWRRSEAHQRAGEWRRQAELATACRDRAAELGTAWLEARCSLTLASAEQARGRDSVAEGHLERASDLFGRLGDTSHWAVAMELEGLGHLHAGHLDKATVIFAEVETLYEEDGNRRGRARVLTHRAHLASLAGDPATAERLATEAVALFGDSELDAEVARALTILATERFFAWRLRDAAGDYSRALALADRFGLEDVRANVLANLGEILLLGGELDDAHRLLEQASKLDAARGDAVGRALDLRLLARVERERGDPETARRLLRRSLELLDEPATRLELAWLAERPEEAESLALQVLDREPESQDARRVVARARLDLGRPSEAAAILAPVLVEDRGEPPDVDRCLRDPPSEVPLALLRLEIDVALGSPIGPAALDRLETLAADLEERGFGGLVFDVRFARLRLAGLAGMLTRDEIGTGLDRLIAEAAARGQVRRAEMASARRTELGVGSETG